MEIIVLPKSDQEMVKELKEKNFLIVKKGKRVKMGR
jgi:hypothetical protein